MDNKQKADRIRELLREITTLSNELTAGSVDLYFEGKVHNAFTTYKIIPSLTGLEYISLVAVQKTPI